MNRTLQRRNVRRFSARKHGGGYGMGAPLVPIPAQPGGDWSFAVKQPVNQGYDDCAFPARPGELFNQPNPALAQVPMVGGGASPFYTAKEWPTGPVDYTYKTDPSRAQVAMVGGGDDNLTSHAYMAKEWPQVVHDSGNPATKWGDVSMAQVAMVGGMYTSEVTLLQNLVNAFETTPPHEKKAKFRDLLVALKNVSDVRLFSGKSARRFLRTITSKLNNVVSMYPGEFDDEVESVKAHFRSINPDYNAIIASSGGKRRKRSMRKRGGGNNCGCSGSKLFGGARRRSTRKIGGGTNGYAVDPSVSVGGSGPNVAPLHTGVPCDGRAGVPDALNPPPGPMDPRAPTDLYSLTPNQTAPSVQAGGGLVSETPAPAMVGSQPSPSAYAHGNAYGPECYKAPGSELPVYNADVAGFHFRPSTEVGGTLPDGVTAYNDVVPMAARVGGSRKKRRTTHRRRRSVKRRATSRKH